MTGISETSRRLLEMGPSYYGSNNVPSALTQFVTAATNTAGLLLSQAFIDENTTGSMTLFADDGAGDTPIIMKTTGAFFLPAPLFLPAGYGISGQSGGAVGRAWFSYRLY